MTKVRRRWLVDRLRDDANALIGLGFDDLGRRLHQAATDILGEQAPADQRARENN